LCEVLPFDIFTADQIVLNTMFMFKTITASFRIKKITKEKVPNICIYIYLFKPTTYFSHHLDQTFFYMLGICDCVLSNCSQYSPYKTYENTWR